MGETGIKNLHDIHAEKALYRTQIQRYDGDCRETCGKTKTKSEKSYSK
jgi:hypothetical protein